MRIDLQIAAHLSQQVAPDFFLSILQGGEVRTFHRFSIGQMCPRRQAKTQQLRETQARFSVYSGGVVINQYIAVALRRAHYELLENGEGFYGSIPELAGVWAQSLTLEECRDELKSALEDWLLFSLSRQGPIPVLKGIDLVVR